MCLHIEYLCGKISFGRAESVVWRLYHMRILCCRAKIEKMVLGDADKEGLEEALDQVEKCFLYGEEAYEHWHMLRP